MNSSDNTPVKIIDHTEHKRVLYITTKNSDYLRVQQEISILEKYASDVIIISSDKRSYLTRLPAIYWKILWQKSNFDCVFIGFAPQLVLPLFAWKFRKKIKIIDFFISMYDTIVFDRKLINEHTFLAKAIKWIDSYTLKSSDLIICDTHEHERYFIDELGAPRDKTAVLYLNADPKYYYPRTVSKPDHLKDKFVVLYFGSVLPLQGIDIVIKAANLTQSDSIHFIIIGPVNSTQAQNSNQNITYIAWLSQDELADNIAFSDLCLAGHFNSNIEKARRVIPGKAYIYEAMKKKIVLGNNKANKERYPSAYRDIVFVEMGDEYALSRLIMDEYKITTAGE